MLCGNVTGAQVVDVAVTGGHNGASAQRALAVQYNREGEAAQLPPRLFSWLHRNDSGFRQTAQCLDGIGIRRVGASGRPSDGLRHLAPDLVDQQRTATCQCCAMACHARSAMASQ